VQFTNEFRVPVDVETAFTTLTDLERVAPCMPGAQLEEVDGDTYTGRVKVKVGPIQVTYRGTAEIVDIDPDGKRAAIRAKGKETRGAGTAAADVVATLAPEGDETTRVTVVTDLAVTGKPAQFGRGVMADVGARIIETFALRLEELLEEDGVAAAGEAAEGAPTVGEPARDEAAPGEAAPGEAAPGEAAPGEAAPGEAAPGEAAPGEGAPGEAASGGAAPGQAAPGEVAPGEVAPGEAAGDEGAPAGPVSVGSDGQRPGPGPEAVATGAAAAAGPRRIEPTPGREDDVLDLVDVAGAATLKRVVPLLAVLAALAGLLWWWRRR
jgi:uncharacterized protein